VVETMIYMIRLRNQTALPTTDVVLTNALPPGLDFVESDPPPTGRDDNVITYRFSSVGSGATKVVVIKANLSDQAEPGMTLTNRATVLDAQGNSAQSTFTGGVRKGVDGGTGRLEVSMTTARRVTITGDRPGRLQSTVTVTNGGRTPAANVVVTLEGPSTAAFSSAIPGPSSQQVVDGKLRLTWTFPSVKGPGNESIKVIHDVAPTVPNGTVLNFAVSVSAADGRTGTDSRTVEVVNRN
jgi:hypothetical protein